MRPVGSWLDHVERRHPLGVSAGGHLTGVDQGVKP